ncbi:patatin-like phospholipase family protein [Lentzea sp. NBRC 105346]|uniref:patatin-like phospholipase family protein n=1 Tax=Lentzea sp. NBRC 105346 TaxID=3032205 RepID=UPI002552D9CA|nr:patatin-like phospholipase family protein [Lentzea sp. NBRC 105346]
MTTAFVLAGGGSLGAVEAGMLAALAEAGIRPDLVCGTSVGAVNGAWIAARPDTEGIKALADLWISLSRNDIFPVCPPTITLGALRCINYLVPNSGLRRILEKNLPYDKLEDAEIPIHVTATDVVHGEEVLLSTGDTVESVLASTAIPGVFKPIRIGELYLMDGGAVNNNPVSHAVMKGGDPVWVLPTGYACSLTEPPATALDMVLQAVTLAVNHRLRLDIERYRDEVELKVVPSLCPVHTSPADFSQSKELIDRAHRQTREWLEAGAPAMPLHPDTGHPHS